HQHVLDQHGADHELVDHQHQYRPDDELLDQQHQHGADHELVDHQHQYRPDDELLDQQHQHGADDEPVDHQHHHDDLDHDDHRGAGRTSGNGRGRRHGA